MSQYQATMPDGSSMIIEVLNNTGDVYVGEFVMTSETGELAHQTGSFEGSVSGNAITAVCEPAIGEEFRLTGTADGDRSLDLARSDMPGTVLHFVPLPQADAPATRADTSFNLNTGATSARVTISTSPYSVTSSITEYRGTWNGVPVTFWSYPSGYASIVIYVDDLCIETVNLSSYHLSDFPRVTATSLTAQTTVYSLKIKSQVKFRGTVTVSP